MGSECGEIRQLRVDLAEGLEATSGFLRFDVQVCGPLVVRALGGRDGKLHAAFEFLGVQFAVGAPNLFIDFERV